MTLESFSSRSRTVNGRSTAIPGPLSTNRHLAQRLARLARSLEKFVDDSWRPRSVPLRQNTPQVRQYYPQLVSAERGLGNPHQNTVRLERSFRVRPSR